jgi:pimeloyl-ACP methyl ester carboxylesterase
LKICAALVKSLGIGHAVYIGHSLGGMTAIQYALMFPHAVQQLVLVNPIGLEDWQAKGAPYLEIDKDLIVERQTNFDSIKEYEKRIYYGGQWQPQYDRWVEMLAGMFTGSGGEIVSRVQAQIFDMAFTQPVVQRTGSGWKPDNADDRPTGPDRARGKPRSAGGRQDARKLSGTRARGGSADPECKAD